MMEERLVWGQSDGGSWGTGDHMKGKKGKSQIYTICSHFSAFVQSPCDSEHLVKEKMTRRGRVDSVWVNNRESAGVNKKRENRQSK
jgi:hypothetical protein